MLTVSAPDYELKVVPEHTDAWVKARIGHLTASNMSKVLAISKKDGKVLKPHRDLAMELVAERLTGISSTHYVTDEMQWGIDQEETAKKVYEEVTGNQISHAGFVHHPSIEWLGASPDAFVNHDGLAEFKCPKTVTHLQYLIEDLVPEAYQPQMLLQMLCTGRTWCDFVSFDPRLPPQQRMFIRRFHPTTQQLQHVEREAKLFLAMVEALLQTALKKKDDMINSADERSLNVLAIKMVQMQADMFLRYRQQGESPKDSEFLAMKEVIGWIKLGLQG